MDIVERLRGPIKHPQESTNQRSEAADEIERLRAEIKKLRAVPYGTDMVECCHYVSVPSSE